MKWLVFLDLRFCLVSTFYVATFHFNENWLFDIVYHSWALVDKKSPLGKRVFIISIGVLSGTLCLLWFTEENSVPVLISAMCSDFHDGQGSPTIFLRWTHESWPFYLKIKSDWPMTMRKSVYSSIHPGSAFIKPDQRNPWIKDQIKITLLPTISHLLLPNFVSCGRACPSHMTQNLVTVGAKLWTADRFIVDPWSMDYADPVL